MSHGHGINGQEGLQGTQGQVLHPLHITGEEDPAVHEDFPDPGFELGQDRGQGSRPGGFRFPGLAPQDPEGQEEGRQAQDCHHPIDEVEVAQAGRVPGG